MTFECSKALPSLAFDFLITKTNMNNEGKEQGNIEKNNIIQNNTNIANYENNIMKTKM